MKWSFTQHRRSCDTMGKVHEEREWIMNGVLGIDYYLECKNKMLETNVSKWWTDRWLTDLRRSEMQKASAKCRRFQYHSIGCAVITGVNVKRKYASRTWMVDEGSGG